MDEPRVLPRAEPGREALPLSRRVGDRVFLLVAVGAGVGFSRRASPEDPRSASGSTMRRRAVFSANTRRSRVVS